MAVKLETIPLAGGLDEASGKTAPRPGVLIGCENFESAYGTPGYRRIAGYERLDGRLAPSEAGYSIIPFDTGAGTGGEDTGDEWSALTQTGTWTLTNSDYTAEVV
jgi:hypothetical protein